MEHCRLEGVPDRRIGTGIRPIVAVVNSRRNNKGTIAILVVAELFHVTAFCATTIKCRMVVKSLAVTIVRRMGALMVVPVGDDDENNN